MHISVRFSFIRLLYIFQIQIISEEENERLNGIARGGLRWPPISYEVFIPKEHLTYPADFFAAYASTVLTNSIVFKFNEYRS
jgi:hypothetical protein